ncbi:MAG: hypothetical protein KDH08_14785 [Anaerolineae bacterium]|nr:hypothetical protein [Anaerolineae bacterium]MCB9129716.1 hypothetical protein [Anaerolineales bacterium]MCB0229657.1 hypothetical protein [Anaerolineae bacterium]MCB0236760.1 hypothetical protein [Anaerolineae bacterium]MCB0239873.1 hypothetical protein [Anaerolineae bacterium]
MKSWINKAYIRASEPKKASAALLVITIVVLAIAGAAPDAPHYNFVLPW